MEIHSINPEIDVTRLDPARFVDLDLGGEEMRHGAFRGLLAQWGRSQPFYVVNQGIPHAVVGRYKDVREVYMDRERLSVTPPGLPGYEHLDAFNGLTNVTQMDGEEHDRVRPALMPSFGPAALNQMDQGIRRIVDDMLDEVEALGGSFDFINDFAHALVARVLFDGLLGMSAEQQKVFVRINDTFPLLAEMKPGGPRPKPFLDALDAVIETIGEMTEERRIAPRPHDFVSTLVGIQDSTGTITKAEVVNNIFAILGGGQGTTAASAAGLMLNLCKHRDQFDQVVADPDLIPQTIEESLRCSGPGYLSTARYALRDCEIGGVPILKGMPVLISQQAGNLDPDVFPDPLTFDIHRKPKNILTFGTGMHLCVGNRFARQIIAVVLEKVCLRFPGIRLQDPDFFPRYEGGFAELRPASMPVRTH